MVGATALKPDTSASPESGDPTTVRSHLLREAPGLEHPPPHWRTAARTAPTALRDICHRPSYRVESVPSIHRTPGRQQRLRKNGDDQESFEAAFGIRPARGVPHTLPHSTGYAA